MNEWDEQHANLTAPVPYGGDESYRRIAEFVNDCATVEDWGCGAGWLRTFVTGSYVGVDGSVSPFADVHADLVEYRSTVEAVVLRHVLEHNTRWKSILRNASRSATRKLCIVLFTPTGERTRILQREPEYGNVPTISFRVSEITDRIAARWPRYHVSPFESDTFYGSETMITATR